MPETPNNTPDASDAARAADISQGRDCCRAKPFSTLTEHFALCLSLSLRFPRAAQVRIDVLWLTATVVWRRLPSFLRFPYLVIHNSPTTMALGTSGANGK